MQISRQRKPTVRIEMSPLVDCIFLLLIFFLLSSTFLAPKIPLVLPRAAAESSRSKQDSVVLTLNVDGQLYLNGKATSWQAARSELPRVVQATKSQGITIRCDELAAHKHFVRALDLARRSGAKHVNVAHTVERR